MDEILMRLQQVYSERLDAGYDKAELDELLDLMVQLSSVNGG